MGNTELSNSMDDRRSIAAELEQTQLALQMIGQLNQIKTGLLAQTAHELRSPLGSLMSLLQLILNDLCEDPQEEREFLRQAYSSAHRLMTMIDELVRISKVAYGAIALELRPLEMSVLLEEVYASLHLQAANRNIRLTVTPSDRALHCLADEGQLLSILVMLLDSAIRHQEGSSITLSWAEEGSWVVLAVQMPWNEVWLQPPPAALPLPTPLTPAALEEWSRKISLSPGMQWQLAEIVIERMGGRLSIDMPLQEDNNRENLWRFQLPKAEL